MAIDDICSGGLHTKNIYETSFALDGKDKECAALLLGVGVTCKCYYEKKIHKLYLYPQDMASHLSPNTSPNLYTVKNKMFATNRTTKHPYLGYEIINF